ncbi:MAG: hypothetical protein ACOYNC_01230 [Bacteroidales bacterium]
MKTVRTITTNDAADNRLELGNQQIRIPRSKLLNGSVANKYPVTLDDGKTIIFISDRNKETETRQKYELQVASRFVKFVKKP